MARQKYEAVLASDANIQFAREGRQRVTAQQRARTALASIRPEDVTGCALEFDAALRRHLEPAALARALDVVGLMNVQFAVKDDEVYIIEVNPRASRTVPFVAKATGVPIAKIAARLMARFDADRSNCS